jgi:uncharacterized integral membrane protein
VAPARGAGGPVSASTPSSRTPAQPGRKKPKRKPGNAARLLAGLILGGIVTAFAVLNLDQVKVNWILGTWSTPLIIVIAVSFLLGVGAGTALHLEGRRRARKKRTGPGT